MYKNVIYIQGNNISEVVRSLSNTDCVSESEGIDTKTLDTLEY